MTAVIKIVKPDQLLDAFQGDPTRFPGRAANPGESDIVITSSRPHDPNPRTVRDAQVKHPYVHIWCHDPSVR